MRIISALPGKRPGARFQSVRDIAFALEEFPHFRGSHYSPETTWNKAFCPPGVGRCGRGGSDGSWGPSRARWRTPPTVPLDSRRIVVTVFNNQTDDPGLDPLGRMTSDWITQGLSRIKGLDVAPSTSVLVAQPAGAKGGLGFQRHAAISWPMWPS